MAAVLSKKQMSEEDIKLQYITPAIQDKWGLDHVTMETKITDGKINQKAYCRRKSFHLTIKNKSRKSYSKPKISQQQLQQLNYI